MLTEALDEIAWDFATFAREMIDVDDAQEDLDEPVSHLATLVKRLRTALDDRCEGSSSTRTILTNIALMEANAVQDHVAWLERFADSEAQGEVIRRLTLAASQGWTAIEILQRAQA